MHFIFIFLFFRKYILPKTRTCVKMFTDRLGRNGRTGLKNKAAVIRQKDGKTNTRHILRDFNQIKRHHNVASSSRGPPLVAGPSDNFRKRKDNVNSVKLQELKQKYREYTHRIDNQQLNPAYIKQSVEFISREAGLLGVSVQTFLDTLPEAEANELWNAMDRSMRMHNDNSHRQVTEAHNNADFLAQTSRWNSANEQNNANANNIPCKETPTLMLPTYKETPLTTL